MSLKSIFSSRQNMTPAHFDAATLAEKLNELPHGTGSSLDVSSNLAKVSVEGFGNIGENERAACEDMYATMQSQMNDLGFESYNMDRGSDSDRVSDNMILAGTVANLAEANQVAYKKSLQSMRTAGASSDPNVITIDPMMAGPFGSVPVLNAGQGLENYNEKSNRDFRVISVAYNISAARQDAFGEAAYPTVVVNPTEGGVTQNLTYAAVLQDVFHEVTGALWDSREVNMVEAFRDPTILEDASTHIVPVIDAQDRNLDIFVDPALVAARTIELEHGGAATTAPLKMGAKFDLIGSSNHKQLVAGNMLDVTDTIDPALRLKNIYVRMAGGKVVRFIVERMPTAVFTPSLTGDTRIANLSFMTEDLVLTPDSTTVDKTAQPGLTEIANRNWTLRLSVGVSGSVQLNKGATWLNATPVVIEHVFAEDGQRLSQESSDVTALKTALGDLEVIGYDLDARFTNTNRRARGQLVQTRTLQFRYPIPMHSPITLPMSTMDENGPGDVVKTLTVATNIRNSNNAVTRMLNYLAQLKDVVSSGYDRPKFGAVEGALSAMIRPTYRYASINLADAIDTIRSKDRYEDVAATLLNTIRSLVFPAYRDSNIEAAFQTVTGNADERPKFVIACDKELAHYLMVKGDDRTLGAYLKYDIVSTNNEKFDGKIVIFPTREKPVENDILNWGQFYYVPTIIADLPISRNGQVSREIAAVPFNLHVNNIPFAIEIDVRGLADVMGTSNFTAKVGTGFDYPEDGAADEPVTEPTP